MDPLEDPPLFDKNSSKVSLFGYFLDPKKIECSAKCASPGSSSGSSNEPASIHNATPASYVIIKKWTYILTVTWLKIIIGECCVPVKSKYFYLLLSLS